MTNKAGGQGDLKESIRTVYLVIGLLTTIFVAIFGWQLTQASEQNRKIESINATYTDIQTRLSAIDINILWIKTELKQK